MTSKENIKVKDTFIDIAYNVSVDQKYQKTTKQIVW